MTFGKFEVFVDKAGAFRFHLKAPNGSIIAQSQGYSTKAACMKGIESIKTNAPKAEIVELAAAPQ
ncbi:MAG: YegP family protein [Methanomicrobiaceae archaeon]|nr:YegP family protein [Methanomicrobiaceae archaeon]